MADITKDEYEFYAKIIYEKYYNEETSWGAYGFVTKDDIPELKKNNDKWHEGFDFKGQITGCMQKLNIGEEYRVIGVLTHHKIHGASYSVSRIVSRLPKTLEEQQRFLESIFTINQAKTILEQDPNIVENVMNNKDNVDISKLNYITDKKWQELRRKIVDNFVISDILSLLAPIGVTFKTITRLCDSEKNPALLKEKLLRNPYILTKIKGFGFKKVDIIALKINPELVASQYRAFAYIRYHLQNIESEGHTWTTISELKKEFSNNVPECMKLFDIILEEQEQLFKKHGFCSFKILGDTIGMYYRYITEQFIFDKLYVNNQAPSFSISDRSLERGIHLATQAQGFSFDENQNRIIKEITQGNSNVHILTGYAGTGKSSVLRGVISAFKADNKEISLCALSACASIVAQESTGHEAHTIHKTLGVDGMNEAFIHNEKNPLSSNVIIIDEFSMVSSSLFASILKATRNGTKIILVGDGGQLPAIGYGNLLNDLLTLNNIHICTTHFLYNIYRQAQDSGITTDANLIRKNKLPFNGVESKIVTGKNRDMMYRFFDDNVRVHNYCLGTYLQAINKYGLDSTILIVPRKSDCLNSTRGFNTKIQEKLLGHELRQCTYVDKEDESYKKIFKVGDKVMQMKNDYDADVTNGEIGYVIEAYDQPMKRVVVQFGQDKQITYLAKPSGCASLQHLELAYAQTVHKMQGSGFPFVIGCLDTSHYQLLDSTLLYTLLTRAKDKCIIASTPKAFARSVYTSNIINRQTYLKNITEPSKLMLDIM